MGRTTRMVVATGLGLLAGGAKAMMDMSLEEHRAKVLADRDAQLSKIRMQEHSQQRETDVAIANREREAAAGRMSSFYQQNAPGEIDHSLVTNDDEGTGLMPTAVRKETRRETAERQHRAAQAKGDKEIIAQTAAELKDVKLDEKGERDDKRLDFMQTFQQRQAERQDKLAEATLAHQKRMETAATERAKTAEAAAQRQATAAALKGVSDDIRALEKDMSGDPKVIERQLTSLRAEAAGYRARLASAGLPEGEAAAPNAADPLGIRKPGATPAAAPKPAAPAPAPAPAAPAGLLATAEAAPAPADPMSAKYNDETRLIELGKLQDYSPDVKQWLQGADKAKAAGNEAYLERERRLQLERSRGLVPQGR